MSEETHTHQIVSREPYESCNVELSENTKGELRITVKMLKGGPEIDETEVVDRAWKSYLHTRAKLLEHNYGQ